jgi:hypothetical protein
MKQIPSAAYLFLANGSEAIEDNVGELSESHADLTMTDKYFKRLHQKKQIDLIGKRCGVCITRGIGTIDPRAVLSRFLSQDSLSYFFVVFTGHGNKEGLWVFDQYTVGLLDMLRLWYFAREGSANPNAKLVIINDSCYAGQWISELHDLDIRSHPLWEFAPNVAIQGGCLAGEQAFETPGQGSRFLGAYYKWQDGVLSEVNDTTMQKVGLTKIVSQTPCMCVKWQLEQARDEVAAAAEADVVDTGAGAEAAAAAASGGVQRFNTTASVDPNNYALEVAPGLIFCGRRWGGVGLKHDRQPKKEAAPSAAARARL